MKSEKGRRQQPVGFESLFHDPERDDEIITSDLYQIAEQDANFTKNKEMTVKEKMSTANFAKKDNGLKKKRSTDKATIASPMIDAPITKELTKLQKNGVIAPKMQANQGRQK